MDDDQSYSTERKDIYIGGIGQVTALNRRSRSGGPEGLRYRNNYPSQLLKYLDYPSV